MSPGVCCSTRMIPRLEIASEELLWSFDADGALFRLVSEAYRISLAYLFDPLIAVYTSLIEPLPHQVIAVYETMLTKQPFFGQLGELRDRAFEDQIHRASCLHLLMAAIAAWNTVYLTEAVATVRKRGEEVLEATIAHIAPLGWEHISLTGNYHFAPQTGCDLSHLRPLLVQEENKGA